jgi:cytochrome c5
VITLVLAGSMSTWNATAQNSKSTGSAKVADHAPPAKSDGEKLFQINCSRCHSAPDSLSPRIAKTVLQHMRVRAMLSKKDEQAILSYIAP